MADVSRELEGVRLTIKEKTKYFFSGTLMLNLGFIVGALLTLLINKVTGSEKAAAFFGIMGIIIAFIGIGRSGWPILKMILFGSSVGDAFSVKADYELVTTDSYGNKLSSDGGAQSLFQNFLGKLAILVIVYFFSGTVMGIQILILSIKGLGLTAKAKPKPTAKPSVGSLALKNLIAAAIPLILVILWSGFVLVAGTKAKAENEAALEKLISQITVGTTVVVSEKGSQIFDNDRGGWTGEYGIEITEKPEYSGSNNPRIKHVKEGDILTITGKAEKWETGKSIYWFVPIEHQGNRGYIKADTIAIKK